MKPETKIQLLKRKFQSLEYIEDFINNYQTFINTGLKALDDYKAYRKLHPEFIPNKEIAFEEKFWDDPVKPNFIGMLSSSNEALNNAHNGKLSTVRSLAGDFRGLSRGFDGVRENFMDIVDPEVRKKYLSLYKQTSRQADNVAKTINDWWKDSSILDEEITGPIDEAELLDYLKPGERAD